MKELLLQSEEKPECEYLVLLWDGMSMIDEREKKKMLDETAKLLEMENAQLYAFALMDRSFHLLAGEMEGHSLCPLFSDSFPALEHLNIYHTRVNSDRDLVAKSCEIHRIPIKNGFAARPSDYWWSSCRAYLGYYTWPMLDTGRILGILNERLDRARIQYRRLLSADAGKGKKALTQVSMAAEKLIKYG